MAIRQIRVLGDDVPITVEGFGLFARALCHETDHLDGILYPDVAEEPARDVTMEEVE